jgi:hypothetical protein
VHEGGFDIRCDGDGERYFVRSDGRVIPRCGYRLDDMVDDHAEDDDASYTEAHFAPRQENPSAEGSPPIEREPVAEVRETASVYRIEPRAQRRTPARAQTRMPGAGNALQ